MERRKQVFSKKIFLHRHFFEKLQKRFMKKNFFAEFVLIFRAFFAYITHMVWSRCHTVYRYSETRMVLRAFDLVHGIGFHG